MFQKRRASSSIALAGQAPQPQAVDAPPPVRIPRMLAWALGAVAAVPLGAGLWTALPAAQRSATEETLSQLGARLRVLAGWGDPAPVAATAAPSLPGATGAVAPGSAGTPPADAPGLAGVGQRSALAYGDRLSITFYESFSLALEGRDAGRAVATIYPRVDLSAEHVVDEDGLVAIPRLGTFAVAGQAIGEAQSAMRQAFLRVFGRPADVRIAIRERQPIYLLGAVRAPGAFAHRPGMTVLQALASAGGTRAGTGDVSASVEAIRETQRLQQAQARRNRLLVTRARLMALRDDADTVTLPPELASPSDGEATQGEVAALLAAAQETLRSERARHHQQRALAERQEAVASAELRAQMQRVVQLDALIAKKTERLRELEGIAARGSVPQFKLTDIAAELGEVVARGEDARVAVAQGERRVLEANLALAQIDLQHAAGIDKARHEIEQELEDAGPGIAAIQAVIRVLQDAGGGAGRDPAAPPSFHVIRRTPAGPVTLAASELTELLPGDVLEVGPGHPDRARPGATSNAATQ